MTPFWQKREKNVKKKNLQAEECTVHRIEKNINYFNEETALKLHFGANSLINTAHISVFISLPLCAAKVFYLSTKMYSRLRK